MRNIKAAIGRLALAATAFAAVSATAGIKYWDNPDYRAFDVDCYVPGAVWNLDGIRNVGADQPHSTTTTTWKNLGTSGANNDIWVRYQKSGGGWSNLSAPDSLAPVGGRNLGSWTENGFTFTGDSEWRAAGSGSVARIESGTNYTIQVLVNGDLSTQTYSKPYIMSVQQTDFCLYGRKSDSKLYWGMSGTTANHVSISGNQLGYMTAIANADENTVAFFSGTTIPTSGDGFRNFSVSAKNDNGYCICGYTGNDGQFVGTIHSYRYYKKALSNEEVAWNRVVDERRFFDRVIPIPVTNAVVVSSVAASAEPSGTYAVDGRHVFTAPRVATVGNAKFICTGYTLEEWDDATGDWGTAVFHARELSCKVEDTDCVRITWKWMDGGGIATYDVTDYVWDGLAVFYDGICNQGTNVAHSTTATNWVNLGSVGRDNDMFVQRLKIDSSKWVDVPDLSTVGVNDPGYWTDNGFTMKGTSRFRCNTPGGFDVGTSYSLQMLVDANASDQVNSNYAYLLGAQQDQFALRLSPTNGKLFFRYESGTADSPYLSGGTFDYVTAIMRDTGKQTIFSGTTEPTSGDGYREDPACGYSDTGFAFGGYSKEGVNNRFVGTIKNFRQYDHALTAAEVAQNRKVDNWRYFGKFAETDVIVQSTYAALQGNEPDGEYDVDGSHTFTAPASVTIKVNGREIAYACDGYTVETWGPLANKGDGWSAATHYTGTSYAYTTAAGKVRLTWKWKATHGLRTAADYGFDDYSQAGIVWNFDGIYNQGVGVERSTTATTWKNLAPNPVTDQIFIQRLNSNKNGYSNNDSTILGSLIEADGSWTENDKGFTMKGASRWRGLGQVGPVANWTIQSLIDADVNDIADDIGYVVSASWSNFATVLRKTGNGPVPNSFHFNAQDAQNGNTRPYFQNESGKYGFATAILDSSDRTAKMFQGVTPPSGGTIADGYYQYSSITPYKDNNFGIGAPAGSYNQFFIGTLKSIRYYDRVLTEEEIVRNRNVDAVRYFGALGVTNVVVGTEAYKVEGSWTFTAPSTVDGKKVTGYRLAVLEDGEWATMESFQHGTEFVYSETDPDFVGKTIKLEWAPEPPGMMIIVK